MNENTPTLSALRRKARRKGYKLSKIRETSRWYDTYGPYVIANAMTNSVLCYGMTAEAANEWINSD